VKIIDARVKKQYAAGHVDKAMNLPHAEVRANLQDLDPETITITYCNKGTTGNAVQNILLNKGIRKVYNLSGGHKTYTRNEMLKKKK
jgi:rhodanese-related sulfurtransferase